MDREAVREPHREDRFGIEKVEDLPQDAQIGRGRIAGRRADASVAPADELGRGQVLGRPVAEIPPRPLVNHFRSGLGEAVGEGPQHDRPVVVPIRFGLGDEPVESNPRGHDEQPHGVRAFWPWPPALSPGKEIGDREARSGTVLLLPQRGQARPGRSHRTLPIPDQDVVPLRDRRKETVDSGGAETAAPCQLREKSLAGGENLLCGRADLGPIENRREGAAHLPGMEERCPVDVGNEVFQGDPGETSGAEKSRENIRGARIARRAGAASGEGQQRAPGASGGAAQPPLAALVGLDEAVTVC